MSDAAWILMNCDLIAVPLQVKLGGVVTVYCGERRANQLLSGLESVARRPGEPSGAQTRACSSTIARSVVPLQSG
jgi:hypothetical protein